MINRYKQYNTKRRFLSIEESGTLLRLAELAKRIRYGGNPEHKKNPGDFGLTPPASPRQGKSLCDAAGVFSRREALKLLREGMRRGLVSDREVSGWPRNIWSVLDGEQPIPLEAQLENCVTGCYHGYPLPASDPFAAEVIARWENSCLI
jgi:hypothetical protein